MGTKYSITEYFGRNLAELLSERINPVYPEFDSSNFCAKVEKEIVNKTYTQRIILFAELLYQHLPQNYKHSTHILTSILGDENPNETGMFTNYYWVMPIGKFVEKYGLDEFDISIAAIEEITKRNTGEYAIRPYIRKYPDKTLNKMKEWALSGNYHLRRLASEGLRPKLPWSAKLDTFINNPEPVFEILEILKEDPVMFVKKSVANHLTDWLKVNYEPTAKLIRQWSLSGNKHTQWIIKRATRKIVVE
ncbi:MAG TPA: 3-methyladenine DNA glycosylase [Bacteroidales bacterium]|jgi:3-methyladenine DNA glycosylase AlkC|nr:3-methyladenine DNA glycosylase [Bacteroidales bacterium]